jgi:hypothetical protein
MTPDLRPIGTEFEVIDKPLIGPDWRRIRIRYRVVDHQTAWPTDTEPTAEVLEMVNSERLDE